MSFKAKHANGEHSWGVNGETGKIVDMAEYGLYESASVKVSASFKLETSRYSCLIKIQILKTAIEVSTVN